MKAMSRQAQPGLLTMVFAFLLFLSPLMGCQGESGNAGDTDKLQIAVIPKGTTQEFWKSIHAGAVKASREADVEIIWQGPQKEDDRQMQIQVVQNFISRQIDAIVLAPLDARSLVRPVEQAVKRDIPVIIIDSGLESEAQTSFVATNNYEGGRLCAKRLAEVLDYKGKIIMLRYMEGSASTTAREEGFLDGLQEFAPDIELLLQNQYAGSTIEKALQASQNILNRFGEIDGIFCPNESSTQGMLRALQTSGRAGKVKLIGFDSNETLINGLRSGELQGLAVQDPFDMGYQGVLTAVATLKGEPVEPRIDTRIMMITADNMDQEDASSLLKPDFERWLNH